MSPELLVGVDVGTSSVKAAVVDATGHELAHATTPLEWTRAGTAVETAAGRLRGLALAVAADALARAPSGRVLGLGVTGMAEAGSLLRGNGEPVAPVIAWHDPRGGAQADRLGRDLGSDRFTATTGLRVSTTPTIVKLAWLDEHGLGLAAADRWLGVPETLVHSLGGAPIADLSLACRTGFLDLASRRWWSDAVDWLGAPRSLLAELVESGTDVGAIAPGDDVPKILHGARLTVAGHDHLTAALGAGATGTGDAFDSCGTAEALVRATSPLSGDTFAAAIAQGLSVSWHVLPRLQALVSATSTGMFLNAVLDVLGRNTPELRDELDAAARAAADSGGLRFVQMGEGEPALAGINRGCSPEHVWHAAVESAACRLAGPLAAVERLAGPVERLIATGGWTRSPLFVAMRRRESGETVLPGVTQAGARGAALMAGVAAGLYPTPFDVPAPPVGDDRVVVATSGTPLPRERSS